MTAITNLNPNTLPALKPLEVIDRRAKEVESVCMLAFSRGRCV